MKKSQKISEIITTIVLTILLASMTLTAFPVQAQEEGGHGYLNEKEGGSIALPQGVTPDLSLDSIAHMSFRPNPVGVGQPLLVNLWMTPPIHVSHYFSEFRVILTKPDGTEVVETMESYRADGTAWFEYTPDVAGTWKIKFEFPGAYWPAGNYTVFAGAFFSQTSDTIVNFPQSLYFKPDFDGPYEFEVTNELTASWPPSQLPSDYWTRPVSPENREWWPILGNYPATGILGGGPDWPANTNPYMSNYWYTPYVQAPNTAHIVWKRQDAIGGLIGGQWGQDSFTSSGASPNIIFAGRCYQTFSKVSETGTGSQNFWRCYDLRTGEVFWERPIYTGETAPSIILYESGRAEVPGADPVFGRTITFAAISGGRLVKYNPYTGAVTGNFSISPLTTGTYFMPEHCLTVQDLGASAGANRYRLINWTTAGNLANLTTAAGSRIVSNISWPFASVGTVDYDAGVAVTSQSISHPATGQAALGVAIGYRLIGVNLYTGAVMWNTTTTDVVSEYGNGGFFSGSTQVADQGRYAVRLNDGRWHCWDLNTGAHLWKGELSSWPWGTFGCYGVQSYGGMILSNQYDGVAAVNWADGKLAWFYKSPAPYPYETPYTSTNGTAENAWFTGTSRIADGKLYTYNTEHTASQPVTRGWRLHCINITNGEGLWSITGSMAPGAVADGYLTAGNSYDGYMYVFGKGQSKTTISAPQAALTQGQSVVLTGTVMDMSLGQPNTPCVSKESMADWMAYLHMQKECPANVTGVPVSIDATDPNGNPVHIADVTSDMSGTYSNIWKPDLVGKYVVTATFMGDDSYGSSYAETVVGIVESSESTAQPSATAVAMPAFELYVVGTGIAVIAVVLIVGLLILRKRP